MKYLFEKFCSCISFYCDKLTKKTQYWSTNWWSVTSNQLRQQRNWRLSAAYFRENYHYYSNETAKDIKTRRSAGKRLKLTFQQFQRTVSPGGGSRVLRPTASDSTLVRKKTEKEYISQGEETFIKTTTSQKKTEGGKGGGGGGGGGGKLDKLPEYLRETVDWFMG